MTQKLQPMHDRILVKQDESKKETSSGIIIANSNKERPNRGVVVAVGTGKTTPLSVKVGDSIFYGKYSGQDIRIGDRDLLVMREDDVLAVILED